MRGVKKNIPLPRGSLKIGIRCGTKDGAEAQIHYSNSLQHSKTMDYITPDPSYLTTRGDTRENPIDVDFFTDKSYAFTSNYFMVIDGDELTYGIDLTPTFE